MKYTIQTFRLLILGLVLSLMTVLPTLSVHAQSPEMADVMRSNGKIYVVVAILVAIFIGIVLYLFVLERRVKKMEDHLND